MNNFNHLIQEVALNGTVKNRNLQVFRIVCTNPGKTAGEIALAYKKSYVNAVPRNEIAKRINDLKNFGLVKKSELRKCPVSGKLVATWTPTGSTTVNRTPKETTNKNLRSANGVLVTDTAEFKPLFSQFTLGVMTGMPIGVLLFGIMLFIDKLLG
jgi:hypothetical protein